MLQVSDGTRSARCTVEVMTDNWDLACSFQGQIVSHWGRDFPILAETSQKQANLSWRSSAIAMNYSYIESAPLSWFSVSSMTWVLSGQESIQCIPTDKSGTIFHAFSMIGLWRALLWRIVCLKKIVSWHHCDTFKIMLELMQFLTINCRSVIVIFK